MPQSEADKFREEALKKGVPEKFLEDIKIDGAEGGGGGGGGEKSDDDKKADEARAEERRLNRQERRRIERLEADKASAIQLAEMLAKEKAAKEERPSKTEEEDFLKSLDSIYGTDTPQHIAATNLLKSAFQKSMDRIEAKMEAKTRELIGDQGPDQEELIAEERDELRTIIEEVEDEYGVDLTSRDAADDRRQFLDLLERMSPKDRAGNIVAYADPGSVGELFDERRSRRADGAKSIAARGLSRSGASNADAIRNKAVEDFLKEKGII